MGLCVRPPNLPRRSVRAGRATSALPGLCHRGLDCMSARPRSRTRPHGPTSHASGRSFEIRYAGTVVTNKTLPKVAPRDLPRGHLGLRWPVYGEPPRRQQVPYEWAVTNFAACYLVKRLNEHVKLQQKQRETQSNAPFFICIEQQFGLSRASAERTMAGVRWLKSADVGRFLQHPLTAEGMRDVVDHYRVLHKAQIESVEKLGACAEGVRMAMLDVWRQAMTTEEQDSMLDGLASAVGQLLTVGAELELSLANSRARSSSDVKWIQLQQQFADSFGNPAATSHASFAHLSLTDHIRRLVGSQPRTIAEIYTQLAATRPDVKRERVGTLLSQLMRAGELERVERAAYRKMTTN